eukprot:754652-Hanusia_phi.AAC.3
MPVDPPKKSMSTKVGLLAEGWSSYKEGGDMEIVRSKVLAEDQREAEAEAESLSDDSLRTELCRERLQDLLLHIKNILTDLR